MRRINFLGCPFDNINEKETISLIDLSVSRGQLIQHGVINVAKLINMRKDLNLYKAVSNCDIINIDGMGIIYGAKFLGINIKEKVSGIDLFSKLLDLCQKKGYRTFFLGGTDEVIIQTIKKIKLLYPKLIISGFHHGYFWNDEKKIVRDIKNSEAHFLFVAISSPKKEIFINRWKNSLGLNFIMGVGGTFDIYADKIKRAPTWMQNSGFEWLYRIYQEPKRMWKRYLITNTVFILLLLREKVKIFFKNGTH